MKRKIERESVCLRVRKRERGWGKFEVSTFERSHTCARSRFVNLEVDQRRRKKCEMDRREEKTERKKCTIYERKRCC